MSSLGVGFCVHSIEVLPKEPKKGIKMKKLITKKYLPLNVAVLLVLAGAIATAQKPKDNVNPARHPNIAAAQRLCTDAWEKIVAAQKANEFDMNGHAQKAKDLLDQVNHELKLAAEAANK